MRKLPRIPDELPLPAGPAKIVWEKNLQEREKAVGKFNWFRRIVTLEQGLGRHAAWLTLRHERVHMVLMDAGVELPAKLCERVCDAIAQADVADMVRD